MLTKKEKTLMLEIGGVATAGLYAFQDARISANNRLRNLIFRKVTGLDYRDLQDKKDKKSKAILKSFADKKIDDHLQDLLDDGRIDAQEHQFILRVAKRADEARQQEKAYEKDVRDYVTGEAIWTGFLKHIRGIGPLLSAALLYYYGYCERAEHISSLWAFAGLTPDSKHRKGERSSFSPRLKMFMMGRLGDCLIKCNSPRYRPYYDHEKARQLLRLETDHPNKPNSVGHAHMRAIRKMVKEFLKDYFLWCAKHTGRPQETKWINDPRYGGHDLDDREDIFDFLARQQADEK